MTPPTATRHLLSRVVVALAVALAGLVAGAAAAGAEGGVAASNPDPGVTADPTDEFTAWFGWHDGAGERGMPSEVIELVPGGEFYDLRHLYDEDLTTRRIASQLAAMPGSPFDAEQRWPTHWFPPLRLFGKGFLAIDLAHPVPSRRAA